MLPGGKFASSFNPTLADAGGAAWVSAGHFGLDQGLVAIMIENHRTGMIWRLMRRCPYIASGLLSGGFRGKWLTR